MARPKTANTRVKRRERKNVDKGIAHIKSTFNNTIVTITDMNGTYSLNISSTNATLRFSYIGYEEQLIKIQGRNVINVKMNEETSNLDEVVVVGYGVQRKSDLTGAISSINAAETLKKMPAAQVADLLQGRIAGLSIVNSSGAAGAAPTLRVRGVNSIKADGGPLFTKYIQ